MKGWTKSAGVFVSIVVGSTSYPLVAQAATQSSQSAESSSPIIRTLSSMGIYHDSSSTPSSNGGFSTTQSGAVNQPKMNGVQSALTSTGILDRQTYAPMNSIQFVDGAQVSDVSTNAVMSSLRSLTMGSSTQSTQNDFAPSSTQYTVGQKTQGAVVGLMNQAFSQKLQQILNDPSYKMSNHDRTLLSAMIDWGNMKQSGFYNSDVAIVETRTYTSSGYVDTLQIGQLENIGQNQNGTANFTFLGNGAIDISKNVPSSTPPTSVAPVKQAASGPTKNQPVSVHLADGTTMGSNQQYQVNSNGSDHQ